MRRAPVPVTGLGLPALVATVAAALLLGACTTPAGSTGRPTGTTATATGTGTPTPTTTQQPPLVVETVFSHTTLDPTRQNQRSGLILSKALYETLTTYDEDQTTVVPGLAEWSISPEGNWLTLRLRAGATFSDGTPVTSDDVMFTLHRAAGMGGVTGALLGPLRIVRVDDRTVTITSPDTNFALPAILTNPALGVLNADVVRSQGGTIGPGDTAGPWLSTHSAGSGPYVLTAAEPGRSVTLSANPRWRGTTPSFREVVVRNASPAQQLLDVQSGAADVVLDLSPGQADAVELQPTVSSVSITTMLSSTTAFLLLNRDRRVNRWTSDPDFADAVRLGLDLRVLTRRTGDAVPAIGLIPTGILGAFEREPSPEAPSPTGPTAGTTTGTTTGTPVATSPPTSPPTTGSTTASTTPATTPPTSPTTPAPLPTAAPVRDLAGARAALARSGYRGQEITLSFAAGLPIEGVSTDAVAAEVKRQLAAVGIRIRLAPAPTVAALDAYTKGRNAMGLWSWAPDYADPESYLAFGPGGLLGRRAGWRLGSDDAVLDAETAARVAYGEDRSAAYERWQLLMNSRSPFVPLFQPASHHAHGDRVTDLSTSPVWTLDIAQVR